MAHDVARIEDAVWNTEGTAISGEGADVLPAAWQLIARVILVVDGDEVTGLDIPPPNELSGLVIQGLQTLEIEAQGIGQRVR